MNSLAEGDCLKALRRALEREDFQLEKFRTESLSDSPIGYMGRHLSLIATVRIGEARRDVRFFVKTPPASGSHLMYLDEMQHFQKELDVYETLVPIMTASLPKGYQLPVPRCFLVKGSSKAGNGEYRRITTEDLLILEDLKEKGYRMYDNMVPFDLEHCGSLMKSVALLHAPSILLQKTAMDRGKGDNFNYIDGTFRLARDTLLTNTGGKMQRLGVKSSVETMTAAVAGLWPDRFGSLNKKKELKERLWKAWEELSELSKPSRTYTNVLCHGDLWANNIMFKYDDEETSTPASVVLIDLQLARFAPAMTDLLIFFHMSTTRSFREEHMKNLAVTYHNHLREIVGKDLLDQLMPLTSFLDSMEEYGLFGKLVATDWLSFSLNSEDVAPMMEEGGSDGEPPDFVEKVLKDRGEEVLLNAAANEVYKTRIMESYRECLEHLNLWK
ncbi:uncharacterized protein LOC124158617 [Ischnura elegans]|uniref:uncharacterized protein LOC124158617 n=1 Tax=Ischnura elegans TaxID=197161 RepID=UPI001ED88FFA|nr:uncharacterized protein LOC124158617 [Ischnura elegans]